MTAWDFAFAPPPDPRSGWDALDQARRDAAYDNNAAVPGSAEWVTARDRDSAPYRAAHGGPLDIPYADRERTKLDLYRPAGPSAPCLVFIHGGYWQRGSREVFAHFGEGLRAAGWAVAMPGYTLAPEASLTQIVAEIGAALDWLERYGPENDITGPVVLAGWSAGAQLVAMQLGHKRVTAGLAISGVFELGPIRGTKLNAALNLTDDEIASFSPLRLPAVPKPLAIAYGTSELPALVNDSCRLYAMRTAAGAPGSLLPVAGADHFSILDELRQPGGTLVRAARALVA